MRKQKSISYSEDAPAAPTPMVREIMAIPGLGETIAVRAAKAHLSALLDWVSQGNEVVVTSGGVAKARLAPIESKERRKVFLGTSAHLKSMPKWTGGPTAEELVRADRDGREW